jgi:hypothetical protein
MEKNSNMFYVYEHVRNDTNAIFYVGKGKNKRAYDTIARNKYWQRIYAKTEGNITIRFIAENIDEELSLLVEIERIDQLKRLDISLSNCTEGGEGLSGYYHTEETKQKMSASAKDRVNPMQGRMHTDDTRQKISASTKGRSNSFKGKKHSDQSRQNMSAGCKGKNGGFHSEEHKRKFRAATEGKPRSQETKNKISLAKTGKKSKYMWITDGTHSQQVLKDQPIQPGWRKGRIMKMKGINNAK